MDVLVRAGRAGTVAVGRRPAAPAGTGLVLLVGADVHVDPTAPDDPPFALVHDAGAAEAGLRALHGRAVADAVLATADDGSTREATAEPGRAEVPTRRLGLVRWLEAHSPDDLPAALLDLEFGAAASALDHLLAGTDADEAADRLRRRAAAAAGLARRLRTEGAGTAPAGLADLLADALPAVAEVLPLADPAADDVTHELELAAALRAFGAGGAVLDWEWLTTRIAGRVPVGAGTRDTPAGVLDGPRTASVDWWQVPRGLLRTDEDTVTWRLTGGAVTVSVTASMMAAPRAAAAALGFRLYSADAGPVPIAVGALRLAADGRTFEGTAPLLAEPTGELVLDVHDPAAGRPPRLGSDRTAAAGARWAARGITALRLGGDAEESLGEAVYLFDRVADEHTRPADRGRAARRAARCRAVDRASAVRLGEAIGDALTAGPPVHASDLRIPDLAGPGWRPLVAETALGADASWRG